MIHGNFCHLFKKCHFEQTPPLNDRRIEQPKRQVIVLLMPVYCHAWIKRKPEDLWPSLEQTLVFYIWSHFYMKGELYGFPKSEQTHIASKLRTNRI